MFVEVCFTGSLKIGHGPNFRREPKGRFRAKQSQTAKLAGRMLQQRSSQQRDGDYGSGLIENERKAECVQVEI
jgi:hypothetical protein